MYERFFGLADAPFRLTPDPRYLFLSKKHAEGLAHLKLSLRESSGFVCITGDVGTGKTTLLRAFLAGLGPEIATAYVFNPALSALEHPGQHLEAAVRKRRHEHAHAHAADHVRERVARRSPVGPHGHGGHDGPVLPGLDVELGPARRVLDRPAPEHRGGERVRARREEGPRVARAAPRLVLGLVAGAARLAPRVACGRGVPLARRRPRGDPEDEREEYRGREGRGE